MSEFTHRETPVNLDSANRHRLRGFNYLAKVVTGIEFKNGIEVKKVDRVAV